MPITRRQVLTLTSALLATATLAKTALAAEHGSRKLDDGLVEITGFLDHAEVGGAVNALIVTAGGETWTVEFPELPANANDQPVGLQLSEGMELTVQGHPAQDTSYRMRATRLIIDGTPYDL